MHSAQKTYSLSSVKAGQIMKVVSVPQGLLRAQFVRLGIHEGEKVHCLERLPGGTIVIRKHHRHIAIGHELAKQIHVAIIDGKE